jgi:hypothetical protein
MKENTMTSFKTLIENVLHESKHSSGISYLDTAKYDYETKKRSFHATSGPVYHGLGKENGLLYAKNLANKHNISVKHVNDNTFEVEGNNNNIKKALHTHIEQQYSHLN